jgi:hypothetical protein
MKKLLAGLLAFFSGVAMAGGFSTPASQFNGTFTKEANMWSVNGDQIFYSSSVGGGYREGQWLAAGAIKTLCNNAFVVHYKTLNIALDTAGGFTLGRDTANIATLECTTVTGERFNFIAPTGATGTVPAFAATPAEYFDLNTGRTNHTGTLAASGGNLTYQAYRPTWSLSGTAGSTGLFYNGTFNTVGTGANYLFDFQNAGNSQFNSSSTGGLYIAGVGTPSDVADGARLVYSAGNTYLGTGASDGIIFGKGGLSASGVPVTNLASIDTGGHIQSKAVAAPTTNSCGTVSSVSGTDSAGLITITTNLTTSCSITFGTAWAVAPTACVVTPATGVLTYAWFVTVLSVNGFTIYNQFPPLSATSVYYMCQ